MGAFESKENQDDVITLKGAETIVLEAGFPHLDAEATADGSLGDETHLNERILQLQKESLATPNENRDIKPEPHLNERILQFQKKELDKSLDTSTEDDGY